MKIKMKITIFNRNLFNLSDIATCSSASLTGPSLGGGLLPKR